MPPDATTINSCVRSFPTRAAARRALVTWRPGWLLARPATAAQHPRQVHYSREVAHAA
jgi:hypothetical protein